MPAAAPQRGGRRAPRVRRWGRPAAAPLGRRRRACPGRPRPTGGKAVDVLPWREALGARLGRPRPQQAAHALDEAAPRRRGAGAQLRGTQLEQRDQLGGRRERIGDRPSAAERQRRQRAAVGLRDQRGSPQRARAVQRGEPVEGGRISGSRVADDDAVLDGGSRFEHVGGLLVRKTHWFVLLRSASMARTRGASMSYKLHLSDVKRDGAISLTQQLVDRFAAAIEDGTLEPGEKLPPTRELAAEVGVNHLTAARVYRRLAELGYVTATVGRGTFVRTLAPAASAEGGDDWQTDALPARKTPSPEQVLSDGFTLAGEPGMLSLATGWPSPSTYPTSALSAIAADGFEGAGGHS